MGTPPLEKNGRDQAQDRTLRELTEIIAELRKELVTARKNMEQSYVRNEDDHENIIEKLSALDKDVLITHVREEEKDKSETSLRRQVFALLLLFLSTASGVMAWGVTESRQLQRDVAENTAHFKEFQAIGIEWGDAIDERAATMQQDIRQLRRLVNEHQRNKQEHSK